MSTDCINQNSFLEMMSDNIKPDEYNNININSNEIIEQPVNVNNLINGGIDMNNVSDISEIKRDLPIGKICYYIFIIIIVCLIIYFVIYLISSNSNFFYNNSLNNIDSKKNNNNILNNSSNIDDSDIISDLSDSSNDSDLDSDLDSVNLSNDNIKSPDLSSIINNNKISEQRSTGNKVRSKKSPLVDGPTNIVRGVNSQRYSHSQTFQQSPVPTPASRPSLPANPPISSHIQPLHTNNIISTLDHDTVQDKGWDGSEETATRSRSPAQISSNQSAKSPSKFNLNLKKSEKYDISDNSDIQSNDNIDINSVKSLNSNSDVDDQDNIGWDGTRSKMPPSLRRKIIEDSLTAPSPSNQSAELSVSRSENPDVFLNQDNIKKRGRGRPKKN